MNYAEQPAEFARAIEDDFLPLMIKPGRYGSLEWVSPPEIETASDACLAATPEFPLAVVVGLKSYERSVNEPQTVATRLALLDSGCFRVGMTYPFGAEALDTLKALKLAPFSGPEFTSLNQADMLVAPLNDWSELSALAQVLQPAGVPFSKARRSQLEAQSNVHSVFPRLVAVIDSNTVAGGASSAPVIANDIFDTVVTLSDFMLSPESVMKEQGIAGEPGAISPLTPNRQIVPQVEVSQQKARFKIRVTPQTSRAGVSSVDISSQLIRGVKLSGLTEIEIEGCANAVGLFDFAEVIDTLAHQIDARRYSILLRDINHQQVTPLLAGALGRFRRVRVELYSQSLSPTALAECHKRFDREQFVACLSLLQIESLQSLHLRLELGHAIDESIEARETCETLRACSKLLNPRRGMRVKFERHISPFAPICEDATIRALFESIKRGSRIKGVTYTLEESPAKLLGALIERNAFGSVAELESILESSQEGPSTDYWNKYAEIFADRMERQRDSVVVSAESSVENLMTSGFSGDSVNGNSANQPAAFGRRKKRTIISTVSAPTKTRLRFIWSVTGPARFLSHLDNIRAIEATLLRSGLSLSYTQGQRPRLKISFGAPKPVGFTSDCEMFDAYFETMPSAGDIAALDALLPPGYHITSASKALTKELSILESIQHATYLIGIHDESLSEKLAEALTKNRLLYTRRNKKREREIDLRPGVFEAGTLESTHSDYEHFRNSCAIGYGKGEAMQALKLTLALTDTFYVRPEEFLDVAGILNRQESTRTRIHRLRFGFESLRPIATESVQASGVAS
jgi:radical SAM-linked protein